jgi:hypothetical protein
VRIESIYIFEESALFKLECHQFITTAWGDSSTSLPSVYRLFKEFSSDRTSLMDKERSGRPPSSAKDENVACLKQLIEENNQVSLRELEAVT